MEIEGYPKYLIYDDGRVYSKKGKGRFLIPQMTIHGYYQVCLCGNSKVKLFKVHRLVALHYIPNPESKPEVDHIDRNPLNNHVSNLRWVTHQENQDNKGMRNDNTSGHKYIYYCNTNNRWIFKYRKRGHHTRKSFKTKQEALVYKFCFLLMLNKNAN